MAAEVDSWRETRPGLREVVIGGAGVLSEYDAVGLPAALTAAGVSTVVASLWPVDDDLAVLFTDAFYRGLADALDGAADIDIAALVDLVCDKLRSMPRSEAAAALAALIDRTKDAPARAQLRSARLDLGARFCCSLFLAAVVCAALLVRSVWMFPVVGGLLLLAVLSYQGTVVTAASYGELINAAVALHRFDLLRCLHLPLPATPAEERTANRQMIRTIRNRMPDETTMFVHPQE